MKKILDIKAFNDFFYLDCFYNNLFSVLMHMGESIAPILLNTSINFEKSKDDGLLSVEYTQYLPLGNLLDDMGTPIIFYDNAERLIQDIGYGIHNNIPTIVFVDCYNEPIRTDTYGKIHNNHCILVYGIDDCAVTILEQSNMGTLNYREMSLSLSDLLAASEGFWQYYIQSNMQPKHRYIQLKKTKVDEALLRELMHHYATETLNRKSKNISILLSFLNLLISSFTEKRVVNHEGVIQVINEIINQYKIRKFLYHAIWGELVEECDDVIREWSSLRKAVFRDVEGIQNNKDNLSTIHTNIKNISAKLEETLEVKLKYFE